MQYPFTEEQLALAELTRDFMEREVAPVAAELDAKTNQGDCYPKEQINKASHLGLRTLAVPKEYGGAGTDELTRALVLWTGAQTELGVIKCLSQCWKVTNAIARLGTDDQKDRWLKMFVEDHDCVVSILSTEPETGSDNIYRQPDPNLGLKTTAVKDGDWYVINGAKRFNSLVSYSKIMLMYARTDPNAPLSEGATCFILRGDQEGIRYGRIEDKMGWRLYPNGDSFYENVRVHKDDILGEVNGAYASMEGIINRGNAELIACSTGLCRALFNVCHQHAKERIQGGKPIIEHPTVASLLADMLTSIEVAEQFMWRVAWGIDNDSTYNSRFTISSKLIGDRLGMHIVPIALDVLGGVGIMKDFPSEKLVRDIITPWHGAGTDSLALLRIAESLDLPA